MRKTLRFMGLIASLLQLTACEKNKKNNVNSPVATNLGVTAAALTGTWLSPCSSSDSGSSSQIRYAFTGDKVTTTSLYFSDPSCAVGLFQDEVISSYTLNPTTVGEASNFDLTAISGTETPKSADFVTSANESVYFGFSDWALDVAKIITDKKQTASDTEVVIKSGKISFNLVKISGTKLLFGALDGDHDTSASEKRPIAIDETETWIKQ